MSLGYSYVDSEQVREQVHDELVDKGTVSNERKFVGYYMSQSLWNICYLLDDEMIASVDAHSSQSQTVDRGTEYSYSSHEKISKDRYKISYRSGYGVEDFNVDGIKDECEQLDIRDVCVTDITVRIDDDALYNEIYDILDETGVYNMDMFEKPLYAEMTSKKVPKDLKNTREWIRDKHPPEYFGNDSDMNWKYRTLELDNIWSRKGWTKDQTIVAHDYDGSGLTVRDLEGMILNYHNVSSPVISPVNARMVTRAWRNAVDLSRAGTSITGTKVLKWNRKEGWNIEGREVD